jgi:hypothetical protein
VSDAASRRLALASVLAAAAPIVVAAVRAASGGWFPIGDNAFFALRARDVLTSHHPLLGTWTSASLSVGRDLNNPGPLLFDLLALPARIDAAGGLAVGVALVNLACVAGIATFAWRRGGARSTALAMAACAGLAWTMGSELLFSPWQPHALLFPFLAFLFAVWSLVSGDALALPWAVVLASVLVQTHLSYAVLVPVLSLVGVAGLVRDQRRLPLRATAVAVAVAIACWLQPLIDQVTGEGNLVTLATNASSGSSKIGARLGTRLVAWVLATPPFWGRSSFRSALYVPGPDLPPSGVVAAAWVTTAALPVGVLGIVPHQLTWLWPLGVFATFSIAHSVPGRAVDAIAVVVAIALALATLPAWNARSGPSADAASIATARRLAADLDVGAARTVLFDPTGLRFAEPYSTVVLLELQRRGVEVRTTDAVLARQIGRSRKASADEAARLPRLVEREGIAALETPPGARVAARAIGLDDDGVAELAALEGELRPTLEEHGLRLNALGRRYQQANGLPALRDLGPVLRDPDVLFRSAELVRIVEDDLAAIDPSLRPRLLRYTQLCRLLNQHTVAIYEYPAGAAA